ncbi:MAG: NADH-quinone oxidoreductase subunit L [Tepidisphaeraceae bacterium]|jgi:NADH-quinone oxidoreductase subunit L
MDSLFAVKYSYLIPLLPLIGAAIAGLFGAKTLRGQSHWPIWLGVAVSAVMSLSLLFGMLGLWHDGKPLSVAVDWYIWIEAGSFKATAGCYLDSLAAVMLCVVTGVGFLITVYAAGYMKGEAGYFRFFAYLGLFIFSMTCLVMGNNFIMLYLGWEGVGLCSYLLIGYYYERPSAVAAAKKAFLVNRIGDFGFGLGIMLIFLTFGTVSYFGAGAGTHTGVLELAALPIDQLGQISGVNAAWAGAAMKWIPFLLMLGAFGKSAQFPLYVWLPDAMEGPTPVSALIHAATMVTAGVYMIARCGTLFVSNGAAMTTVACIGAFTALLAATIALRQFDLKRVFAYSTISQLGYMFVAVGCFAPVAGMFHLVTHAFFKALLFLSSGVVMHAMYGELDMRKMSGLKAVLPKTRWLMLVGCLALAGCPFFSGFFSKDEIVAAALARNWGLGALMLFTAFLTAYYTFRLYFRVFEGPLVTVPPPPPTEGHDSHGHDHEHHNHEPMLMIAPLVLLAIGAVLAGYVNFPNPHLGAFLGQSPSLSAAYDMAKALPAPPRELAKSMGQSAESESVSTLMIVSGLISLAGIGLAFVLHLKDRARGDELAEQLQPLTRILEAKYWVDEIYQDFIVTPLRLLGEFCYSFDRWIVDMLVNMVGWICQLVGYLLKFTTQRGYLQGYGAAMLLGLAAILLFVFMH